MSTLCAAESTVLPEWCDLVTRAGRFTLSPVRPDRDLPLLHRWFNDPVVDEYWELAGDPSRTADYLAEQRAAESASLNGSKSDVVRHKVCNIDVEGDGPLVVREKTHAARPMALDQALYEMELVGHDFYLFVDSETKLPSVVYRRRGYDYGVIRLDDSATYTEFAEQYGGRAAA